MPTDDPLVGDRHRHRTAERVSKQTDALVVAISERRDVVSLYWVDEVHLQDIPAVLAKANQGLATLDKYRARLDSVSTRLTLLGSRAARFCTTSSRFCSARSW